MALSGHGEKSSPGGIFFTRDILCAGGGGSAQGFARPVLLKDGAETELPSPPNL
jgi:hypothetical protein